MDRAWLPLAGRCSRHRMGSHCHWKGLRGAGWERGRQPGPVPGAPWLASLGSPHPKTSQSGGCDPRASSLCVGDQTIQPISTLGVGEEKRKKRTVPRPAPPAPPRPLPSRPGPPPPPGSERAPGAPLRRPRPPASPSARGGAGPSPAHRPRARCPRPLPAARRPGPPRALHGCSRVGLVPARGAHRPDQRHPCAEPARYRGPGLPGGATSTKRGPRRVLRTPRSRVSLAWAGLAELRGWGGAWA